MAVAVAVARVLGMSSSNPEGFTRPLPGGLGADWHQELTQEGTPPGNQRGTIKVVSSRSTGRQRSSLAVCVQDSVAADSSVAGSGAEPTVDRRRHPGQGV